MHRNFASFIQQTRNDIQRSAETAREWHTSFNNVLHSVRTSNTYLENILNVQNERPQAIGNILNQLGNRMENSSQPTVIEVNPSSNSNDQDAIISSSSMQTANPTHRILERVANIANNNVRSNVIRSVEQSQQTRDDEENVSEDIAEVFEQYPEIRRMLHYFIRYVPFIMILCAKSLYDHIGAIFDIAILTFLFLHANTLVVKENSKKVNRNIRALLLEIIYITFVVSIRFFIVESGLLRIGVIFTSTFNQTISLSEMLFSIIINDLVLKLITVLIKILVTLIPAKILKYNRRGKTFVLLESFSYMYRGLVPIQTWTVYLKGSYIGSEKIIGLIFSASYIVAKAYDLVSHVKFCKRAFINSLRKVSYGTSPSKEQIESAGGLCPICHDNYDTPVLLDCHHIFCETCVGTWFSKERTCPLCRAQVLKEPTWQNGSTTLFFQIY